ncbi:MAG TPA: hypothetical protein VLK85_20040 [Ramlibacter sp.]|nr:hypothetical protein [Ramlibacter sp.]
MNGTRQIGIKMSVDATSVSTGVVQAENEFRRLDSTVERTSAKTTRSLATVNMSVRDIVAGAAGLAIVANAIQAVSAGLTSLPRNAFDYSKQLETSAIGMAGILGSMTAINGRQTEFHTALGISQQMIRKLNDDALRTAASSQELVAVFQALLAPGLAARMELDQIRELAVVGTNAVKSMGLNSTQVVQELRDLVAGGITAASSTLATALGLKDEDISRAKASSEGLFKFLMDRLQGFKASSDAYGGSIAGLLDTVQEGATRVAAEGMEPLTQAVKGALQEVSALFVTFDENREARLNPELVQGIRDFALGAADSIAVSKAAIAAVWEHRDAVTALAGAYASVTLGRWVAEAASAIAAKLELAQAARLAAVQAAAEGTANAEAVLTSRAKVAAILAELQVDAAKAQADTVATAAKLAHLRLTQEAIVVSRAEVVASLASARSTMAQAEAQLAASRAAGALSFALALAREATETLTVAQARQAALMTELAVLGRQQTAVQASITAATAAQTVATEAAAVANARMSAAQGAASLTGRAAAAAMGLLGGPIGWVTTLLGMGAVAWSLWGESAEKGERRAAGEVKLSTDEIVADLERQIAKMRQRNALNAAGMGDVARTSEKAADRLSEIQAQMENVRSGKDLDGNATSLPEVARLDLLSKLTAEYARVASTARVAAEEQEKQNGGTQKLTLTLGAAEQAYEKAIEGAKTASAAELEYRQKLESTRQAFAAKKSAMESAGASQANIAAAQTRQMEVEKALLTERDRKLKELNGSGAKSIDAQRKLLAELSGVTGTYMGDLENLVKARDAGNLSEERYIELVEELIAKQPAAGKLMAASAKEAERLTQIINKNNEAADRAADAALKSVDAQVETNEKLREEIALIGLNDQARAAHLIAMEEETIARLELDLVMARNIEQNDTEISRLERELRLRRERIGLLGRRGEAEAAQRAAEDSLKNQVRMLESVDQTAHDVFVDVARNGTDAFERIGDTLQASVLDLLYQMTARNWIISVAGSITGASPEAISQVLGGGQSGTGMLEMASNGYTAYTNGGFLNGQGMFGGVGAGLFGNAGAYASTVPGLTATGAGSQAAMLAAQTGEFGVAGLNATSAAGGGSAMGGAAYAAGAAAAVAVIAYAAAEAWQSTRGEKRGGARFDYDSLTGTSTISGAASGDRAEGSDDLVKGLLASTSTSLNEAFKSFGSAVTVASVTGAYETSANGRGGVFSGGRLSNGALFGETGSGSNYSPTGPLDSKYELWGMEAGRFGASGSFDTNGDPAKLAVDIQQSYIAAIQASVGIIPRIVEETYQREIATTGAGFTLGASGYEGSPDSSPLTTDPTTTRWLRVFDSEMEQRARDLGLLPKRILDLIAGVDPEALSAEATAELTTKISLLVANVNGMQALVEALPVEALRNVSFDFAASLVEASGGLQAFTANFTGYYDNFYSEQERSANITRLVAEELAKVNLALPKTRDEYRAQLDAAVALGEEGAPLVAALLKVQAAFASVTETAEAAASRASGALTQIANSVANMRQRAEAAQAGVTSSRGDILTAYNSARDRALDAQTTLNNLLEQGAESTRAFGRTLTDYLLSLNVGSLSGLDPESRYQMLGAELQSTAALAKAGDQGSRDRITGVADAYLESAMARASTDIEYAREVARVRTLVQDLVETLPAATPEQTIEQQIAQAIENDDAAQLELTRYAELAAETGTSILASTDIVGDEIRELRAAYDAATAEQVAANLRLDVALAALDALGLSESAIALLVSGQTGAAPGDFAEALGVADDVIIALQEAMGWTDEELEALSEALNVAVAPQIYAALGSALGAPSELFESLGAALGVPADLVDLLATGLGVSPIQMIELQSALGLNADTAIALGSILGVDAATREAWATALGVDGSQLEPLATILGWDAGLLPPLATAIGLADTAVTVINALGTAAGFSQAAVDQALALGTAVDFSGAAQDTIAALKEQIGISPAAREIIDSLASQVDFSPAAMATAVALGQSVGLHDGLLSSLATSLGLSSEALAAIAQLADAVQIDTTARNTTLVEQAYASIGRAGFGSEVDQIDAAGFDYWMDRLASGSVNAGNLMSEFTAEAAAWVKARPDDPLSAYVTPYLKEQGVPGFAAGSNYITHDMLAMVHQGEEITPRTYVDIERAAREETNLLLGRLLDSNQALAGELENVNEELLRIKDAVQSTDETLFKVTLGGVSMQSTEVAAS